METVVRKLLKTLLPLLLTILLTLVLCEFLIHFFLQHPRAIDTPLLPSQLLTLTTKYHLRFDRQIIQFLPECAQYDDQLFYIMRPGQCRVKSREFDVLYTFNQQGLRSPRLPDAPKAVLLGDSQAFGWGVQDNETIAARLEHILGGAVVNTAIPSYGTARELMLMQRLGLPRPEAVIILYNENDWSENRSWMEHDGVLPITERATWESTAAEQDALTRYYPGKHLRMFIRVATLPRLAPEEKKPTVSEAEAFLAVLEGHAHLLSDTVLVVAEVVEHYRNNDAEFVRQVEALFPKSPLAQQVRAALFLDLSSHFEKDDFYIMDGHMNAAGHARAARVIGQALAPLLP